MQITCSICSDLFVPTDEIFGTKCGHIFHHQCLLQWLERSSSCPQCRSKSTDKNIYRIFFNVLNASVEDPNVLQNKIDNLNFQLRLKETDIKNNKDEIERLNKQNNGLRDFIKELEKQQRTDQLTIASLKEQIGILKKQNRNTQNAVSECRALREQLEFYKNVELVVNGAASDVDEMLDTCMTLDSVKSLATFTSVLKKEIEVAANDKKELRKKLRASESSLNCATSQVKKLQNDVSVLKSRLIQVGEDLKYSEGERKSLAKKLKGMEEALASPSGTNPSASALKRLIHESPAPELVKKAHLADGHDDMEAHGSGTTSKEDSPYFKVKSSSIGLTPMRKSSADHLLPPNKFSIFKKCRVNTLTVKNTYSEEFYNGFGGHSKLDDFPTPISSPSVKRHRHMPVSRIKLKDASNSLKLDAFVSKS